MVLILVPCEKSLVKIKITNKSTSVLFINSRQGFDLTIAMIPSVKDRKGHLELIN